MAFATACPCWGRARCRVHAAVQLPAVRRRHAHDGGPEVVADGRRDRLLRLVRPLRHRPPLAQPWQPSLSITCTSTSGARSPAAGAPVSRETRHEWAPVEDRADFRCAGALMSFNDSAATLDGYGSMVLSVDATVREQQRHLEVAELVQPLDVLRLHLVPGDDEDVVAQAAPVEVFQHSRRCAAGRLARTGRWPC